MKRRKRKYIILWTVCAFVLAGLALSYFFWGRNFGIRREGGRRMTKADWARKLSSRKFWAIRPRATARP